MELDLHRPVRPDARPCAVTIGPMDVRPDGRLRRHRQPGVPARAPRPRARRRRPEGAARTVAALLRGEQVGPWLPDASFDARDDDGGSSAPSCCRRCRPSLIVPGRAVGHRDLRRSRRRRRGIGGALLARAVAALAPAGPDVLGPRRHGRQPGPPALRVVRVRRRRRTSARSCSRRDRSVVAPSHRCVILDAVEQLRAAIAIANIPTLVPVLVQLTGDERWLEDPYRPRRQRGLGDNDDGGLPEDGAAGDPRGRPRGHRGVARRRTGRRARTVARPCCCGMLSVSMCEPVPPEYGPVIRRRVRPAPRGRGAAAAAPPPPPPDGFRVIVIGAGASGLAHGRAARRAPASTTRSSRRPRPSAAPGGTTATPAAASTRRATSTRTRSTDVRLAGVLRAARRRCTTTSSRVATDLGAARPASGSAPRSSAPDVRRAVTSGWDVDVRRGRRRTIEHSTPTSLISAVGVVRPVACPNIPGLDTFEGPFMPHRPLARRASTSPASASPSSATGPAPCSSCRRSSTTRRAA